MQPLSNINAGKHGEKPSNIQDLLNGFSAANGDQNCTVHAE